MPESRLYAALAGLNSPAPLEAQLLSNLINLVGSAVSGKKWKPFIPPWSAEKPAKFGGKSKYKQKDIVAVLNSLRPSD